MELKRVMSILAELAPETLLIVPYGIETKDIDEVKKEIKSS